jgi:hypothetical protein
MLFGLLATAPNGWRRLLAFWRCCPAACTDSTLPAGRNGVRGASRQVVLKEFLCRCPPPLRLGRVLLECLAKSVALGSRSRHMHHTRAVVQQLQRDEEKSYTFAITRL